MIDSQEIAQLVERNTEPTPDIKTIRVQLLQIMNGDNRIGVDDSTRSLIYSLMQIVEKLSADVESLKAVRKD